MSFLRMALAMAAGEEALPSGGKFLMIRNYTHGDRENPASLVESKEESAKTAGHVRAIMPMSVDGKAYRSEDGDGRLTFGILWDPSLYDGPLDQWGVPEVGGSAVLQDPDDEYGMGWPVPVDLDRLEDVVWGEELAFTFTGMEDGEELFDWLRDPEEAALIEEAVARPDMVAIGFDAGWLAEQRAKAGVE